MDKLKKSQKDEFAVSFAILALYDGGADISSEQINTLLEATGNTEVEAFYPIIFSNFLSDPEKIAQLIATPGGAGGGGGGGGGKIQDELVLVLWHALANISLTIYDLTFVLITVY
jgi:large subunit ribosomal protein LP1